MHPKGLLLAILFSPLAIAVTCDPSLGSAIHVQDCLLAFLILRTRLYLYNSPRFDFENARQSFTLHPHSDVLYRMPQGASFGSCGLGIDIAPNRRADSSWYELFIALRTLIAWCVEGPFPNLRAGLGGMYSFGQFTIMVVESGQGMRNLVGTCLDPNPSQTLPLLLQLRERLCGFSSVTALLPQPNTALLPAAPALPDAGNLFQVVTWNQYQPRGQWVWNADAWSSIAGSLLDRTSDKPVWVLLTAGAIRAATARPRLFSRAVPRVLGVAWYPHQMGIPTRLRGAWGSRDGLWYPLIGDLSYLQPLLERFDWVLVILGETNQAGGLTQPPSGQMPTMRASNQTSVGLDATRTAGSAEQAQQANTASDAAANARSDNPSTSVSDDVQRFSRPNNLLSLLASLHGQQAGPVDRQPVSIQIPLSTFSHLSSASYLPASDFQTPSTSKTLVDTGERPTKRPRPNP